METIECYIANLGKYNEGEAVGGWIKLPVEEAELDRFLKEVVKLDGNYEEYAVHDYNGNAFEFGEYENLHDLNLVAKKLSLMDEHEIDVIKTYWNEVLSENGPIELLNLCYQSDDIPFSTYNFEGMENLTQTASNELKFGYTLAEESGLQQQLEEMKIDTYFDYAQYGTDPALNGDVTLTDNGYIYNMEKDIDCQFYSREELSDMVKNETKALAKKSQELSGKESNLKSRIQTAKEKTDKDTKVIDVKERGNR